MPIRALLVTALVVGACASQPPAPADAPVAALTATSMKAAAAEAYAELRPALTGDEPELLARYVGEQGVYYVQNFIAEDGMIDNARWMQDPELSEYVVNNAILEKPAAVTCRDDGLCEALGNDTSTLYAFRSYLGRVVLAGVAILANEGQTCLENDGRTDAMAAAITTKLAVE